MLPNSSNLIWGSAHSELTPFSTLINLELVPFSFQRITDTRFLYSDSKDQMTTNILSLSFNKEGQTQTTIVEEFMGLYQQCCFGDDHVFLMNKEGDILYYDLINKDSFFVQRQHPFLYSPIQIHNIHDCFVTCGGNIKSGLQENQKLIKLWQYHQDQLICRARIVTGHNKDIQNSLAMGQNRMVTLSTDKTIRVSNIATQQLQQVLRVDADYYTVCQLDWNTLLVGGQSKQLAIYDIRCKKAMGNVKLNLSVIQICQMARMSADMIWFANVNEIYSVQTRSWQVLERARVQGERISKMISLSEDILIVGNRDRSLQLWRYR